MDETKVAGAFLMPLHLPRIYKIIRSKDSLSLLQKKSQALLSDCLNSLLLRAWRVMPRRFAAIP